MVHITGNFLAESPLSPKAREALADALDQGWSDPGKIAHSAARARILRDQALESLAQGLKVRPDELEVLGEPALGHFYAIGGLLRAKDNLVHSSVDRKEIFALARTHGKMMEIPVDISGQMEFKSLQKAAKYSGVFALQAANGETGVTQSLEELVETAGNLRVSCDYSIAGTRVNLPTRWDSAFFDARSWQGPQGIGLVAIRNRPAWQNPLPHIGALRTPQSASLPLLICAAVALEEWLEDEASEIGRLRALTAELREGLRDIDSVDIAGDLTQSLPHITSLSFLYVEGEELLRKLETAGFSVDSGSACTAEDLQPSHVLAAMGLLTHGNIRITLHHSTTSAQIHELIEAVKSAVTDLRAS